MKPPKDVLALGKHLVRELDFEDGFDTLGRWMAHYLAELIDEAENGATASKRAEAKRRATETILKIWEHRLSLPGDAYPLASYKNVLKVLDRLRPDDNPYKFFGRDSDAKKDQLASILFDNITRLLLGLMLMKTSSWKEGKSIDPVAIESLSDEEQRIWSAIQEWMTIFEPPSEKPRRGRKKKKGDDSKIDLNEAAIQFIDNITATLVELRGELQETNGNELGED